jgi:hypothetical protein
MGSYEIEKIN